MIASQTICAPLVVKPHGRCSFDVVNRTKFLAQSAFNAGIFVNPELSVSNQVLVVVATDNVGVGKRNASFHQFFDVTLALAYHLADVRHALTGSLDFLACFFVGVEMQKGETDVRLRHDDGKTRIGMQSFLPQFLLEDTHCIAHVVATGGQGVNVR